MRAFACRTISFSLCLVAATASLAWSGTATYTVQSSMLTSNDAYLKEDNANERNGTKPELRLKATNDAHNRNSVISIPMPTLGARTVLQAWVRLTVSGASSSTPLESRVYPLSESWDEANVSWGQRASGVLWTTPGGTHGATWSGRARPSSDDTGGQVSWSVGPILNAWQRGVIPNYGFVLDADTGVPDREVIFRSSEYLSVPSATPQLVVYATDEPPAIVTGSAEIQPRALRAGASDAPLDLWLDVAASGATPSGPATGFDTAVLNHAGQLATVSVDGVWVNGVALPDAQMSWYDNGSSATVRFPRVTGTTARVHVALRVRLLTAATSGTIELPVLLDDSTTPGAWAQQVWPANADGVAGNGDDWIVAITNLQPTTIDLKPDTATVVSGLTLPLQTYGRDASGNVFGIVADSVQVVPAARGTVTASMFTAGAQGQASLIARYGLLRDTSAVWVAAPRLPTVSQLVLKTRSGSSTATLSPSDSMTLTATVSDGDGFQDLVGFDVELSEAGHNADVGQPAFHARYQWRRGVSGWLLADPVGSSWAVVPGLSVIDTVTHSTGPQAVTLGFVPSRIARASNSGSWTARVRTYSVTPPDTSVFVFTGFQVATRITMTLADTLGAFNSGRPGAAHLPLRVPAEGNIGLTVVSNAAWSLDAGVTHMAGETTSADTLFVGPPIPRIAWAFNAAGSPGGWLDTTLVGIDPSQPPLSAETPAIRSLHLWLDVPEGLSPQDYRGVLRLRARDSSGSSMESAAMPLIASVANAGQAATSAVAEVTPEQAETGDTAANFDVWCLPSFQAGDSGVDRLIVTLPPGWGAPVVTGVTVAGLPVAASDSSGPRLVRVTLGSRVISTSLIGVRFRVSVPTTLDSTGSSFPLQFDDSATLLAPQAATEGDANGVADGNDWRVRVVAGAVSALSITPDPAVCYLDSTLAFATATTDAYGHPTTAAVTWSVLDGVGTIGGTTGLFRGTVSGSGRVVVQSGGVSDTARVSVRPVRGIAVRAIEAPPAAYQGQQPIVVRVRIENVGAEDVELDSLHVRFRRSNGAPADADYALRTGASLPISLPSGDTVWLTTDWQSGDDALTGRLTVDARIAGRAGGLPVVDDGADSTAAFDLLQGGVVVSASQSSASARPDIETLSLTLTIENRYPVRRRLESIALANMTSGPGDADQRDAEAGEVRVYRDGADGLFQPAFDTLLVQTVAVGGGVQLNPLGVSLDPGATARLFVTIRPTLQSRDGDVVDWSVTGPGSVALDSTTLLRNGWPLDPQGGCVLDGLVAAQVTLLASDGTATIGLPDQHVLSLRLPPNGYTPDVLEQLAVANLGTARVGADIERMRAWADDGDGVFSAASDALLGVLVWTGARWQLSGLDEPVPLPGLVVHLTVDVAPLAESGRTIRLSVPAGSYPGIGMRSGDTGPLDASIDDPHTTVLTTSDRLTFGSSLIAPASSVPGDREVPVLHLIAGNSYPTGRTVTSLTLTQASRGAGTTAELDRAFERISLRMDANHNGVLEDVITDPVVGVGSFTGGRVVFGGLSWAIPAGATRSLFATGDVALHGVTDGDSIGVLLGGPADVAVLEPSSILGAWPLASGRSAVDGMVGAQLALQPTPAATLAPADGPVRAFDLIVPRNGYVDDVLQGVRVVNLGTATAGDLAEMRLWRDGGDGQFGGDDTDLGTLVPVPGGWQSALLSEPLGALGARLYISITVSGTPSDSSTLRLAVPLSGIVVASGNDGPRDLMVANPEMMTLSTAPLLVSLSTTPRASTIGQTVQMRLVVRNVGGETVLGARPLSPVLGGTATLTPLGGPAPDSVDLAPAQSDTFTWTYRADAAGSARFTSLVQGLGNPSGIPRRSLEATSDQHQVYASVGALELLPVHSMPPTVRAGQADVVPFSLTFRNPGGPDASDAHVRGLVIRLEDQAANGIVPADMVQRVVVSEGANVYLAKTSIESAGNDLDLQLATPITVTPEQPTTVSVHFDLRDTVAVPTFRAVLVNSSSVDAVDATSGTPVVVAATPPFPLRSGVARVISEAAELDVTAPGGPLSRVSRGAASVPVLDLSLRSPGITGVTSDVRLNALRLVFEDTTGATLSLPNDRLVRLVLRSGAQTLANRTLGAADTAGALVWLSPPLNIPANTDMPLQVLGDLSPTSPLGAFRVRLDSPATADASDGNTGGTVPVVYLTAPAAGAAVAVEAAAETLTARSKGHFPPGVPVGSTGLLAIEATVRHPHPAGTARIRVESIRVRCRDEARTLLSPAAYLSAVHVRWNGADTAVVTSVPASSGGVVLPLPVLWLEPGDSARVDLIVDVSPAAPASFLELEIAATGVTATDANTGTPVRMEPEPGFELPLLSGLTRILPAARDLGVALTSTMPAVLVDDGREVTAGTLRLTNEGVTSAGTITVSGLVVRGGDAAFASLALGGSVTRVSAWHGGVIWAQSAPLTPDSATAVLVPVAPLDIAAGTPADLELRFVTRANPPASALRIGLDATGIGVVQPAGGALTISVHPSGAQSFPLWTETGNFSGADLSGTWSNFPNPFAAGREHTTFAYWLRAPATVSLRLWTLHNENVRTVLDGVARPAGLQQSDLWDGRNGRGDLVRNGVYMAELTVRYDDGTHDRVLRKVAVVR